jgi:hypothetical protein
MHANVPQFINIEDKIAGFLTWKQLSWMIALLIVLIVFYNVFTLITFYLLGAFTSLIFVAFAFVRPYGQSLATFTYYGLAHLFGPKIYIWKREVYFPTQPEKKEKISERKTGNTPAFTQDDIRSLAKTLDKKI